jgi:hypothetical protein
MVYTGIWFRKAEGKHCLKNPVVDGGILLRWIFMNGMEGMEWLDLADDRGRWRDL